MDLQRPGVMKALVWPTDGLQPLAATRFSLVRTSIDGIVLKTLWLKIDENCQKVPNRKKSSLRTETRGQVRR